LFDIGHHTGFTKQVIDWDVEEPLDLRSVEIHGDNMVGTCYSEEVGNESVVARR
jgi:hypothetical protein